MGYIVLNSKFKPFSYQEMLAPIMQAQEAHDKADAEINTLLENAALNASSFGPNDTAEKAIYDDLIGRLKDASGQLSSRGINPSLKRNLPNSSKAVVRSISSLYLHSISYEVFVKIPILLICCLLLRE
jgi:hypothetical protein